MAKFTIIRGVIVAIVAIANVGTALEKQTNPKNVTSLIQSQIDAINKGTVSPQVQQLAS